jgi:hypothetical protein
MDGFRVYRVLAAGVVLALWAGCSVYETRYAFEPRPVDVAAAKPGAGDAEPVHTLVSVIGVRREDRKSQLPASVEVRLRVENTSPFAVTFDPASLALFSAGLERFPDPIARPEGPVDVAPSDNAVIEAFFPFPEGRGAGDFDLNGLNLRWTLEVGGHPVTGSASFLRLPTVYYGHYHYRVGIGYHRYDY